MKREPEDLLPKDLLARASISPGGEHAWRMEDVPLVIEAARVAGLANKGGVIQFHLPDGICELYWLGFGSTYKDPGETWQSYADRSASETLKSFYYLCSEADLEKEACEYDHPRTLKAEGVNLLDYLRFVLYFHLEGTWRPL